MPIRGRSLTRWAGKKGFGPLQSLLRKLKLRLQLIDRGLFRLNVGFEGRLLDTVEQIAFFDLGSFIEEALLKKSRHARDEIDASDSLYPADKIAGFCQGLFFSPDDAHRRRSGRRGLRRRPGGGGDKEKDQETTPRPKYWVTLKIQSALPLRTPLRTNSAAQPFRVRTLLLRKSFSKNVGNQRSPALILHEAGCAVKGIWGRNACSCAGQEAQPESYLQGGPECL